VVILDDKPESKVAQKRTKACWRCCQR
jgi:hypothetical protein